LSEKADQREQRRQKGCHGGRPVRFDAALYRRRNVVERCIGRLKQVRRIATRYENRALHYLVFLHLAAIILWLDELFRPGLCSACYQARGC
jgi:transposase